MQKITGVMVYYYFVCKRKLWYFFKEITMEQNSELVGIGKLVDETTYKREKKNILIEENIKIDFLKDWRVIHEVKKSRKVSEASKWQLRYYIWILRKKGVDIEMGILDYPLLRKREDVLVSEKDAIELENILKLIRKIVRDKVPPKIEKKNICKRCAYYELCHI
ncbi:MAG: CRISPR-associated protein Cas4 [Firmicutes bacterium]|nr:CRISPR-associated protein Cas4 [Bacillota bacterium]